MDLVVVCTLKQYLEKIDAIEKQKPIIKRRHVPTIKDISAELGMYYTTISRIANNKVRRLDYRTAAKIIKVLRNRGFDMQISDLINCIEIETEKELSTKPR